MIDAVIKKGLFHKSIPQDYVLAEDLGTARHPLPFIAVADGCSAGRNSERGAVILTCAAREALRDLPFCRAKPEEILVDTVYRAKRAANLLGLSLDEMIATLRIAYIFEDTLYTIETGDGVSFQIHYDATFEYQEYEYEINAPFYLAYTMFDKVKEYQEIGTGVNYLLERSGCSSSDAISTVTLSSTKFVYKKFKDISNTNIKYFGIATDGLSSYMRTDGSGLQVLCKDIIRELSDIKVPAGEFLTRRFHRMDKELVHKGFENHDDIGIAIINVMCYAETLKQTIGTKNELL